MLADMLRRQTLLCDPDLTRAPPRRGRLLRRIALFLAFVALLMVLPALLA